MEAETNSPEDASSKSVPLVKSIINIGNEEIIFPQKLGTEVNSEYPLVEEKGKADRKTDEVSEIRPQEIHQESCEVCVGSEKQAEVPSDWLKQRDSEGLVMTESIPKSSEHEHEPMSTIPELAINHSEMAEKICEEETYNEEEESTEIDDDKSCRPENDLGKRSKALEAIDQTQFMGKDTAVNEHADHQSEAPSMENVITKHSNSEEKLLAESSIKSNYEEEPLQKILELYSVDNSEIKIDGKVMPEKEIGVPADGTLKTLSTTECIGAEELEKKDEGKFAHEKAKEMEAATEMQLLERASADSPPEEEVQPRLPTPDIVQQKTDQIIKQQSLNEDQPDVIDNAKSCIAENELDRVSTVIEEPVQLETKDNISIVKEQADQQSEETSMQSVTTNYIIEGHVISESTTKLTDDVHESHSIKNLERKDANEIREEATDVKQSIRKTEAKGISEDKALQTLFSAELVGSKTVEERCQEDIKPEAQLAVTYANEEQTPQHEFDTKKEIPEEEACQLTAENEPKSEPQIVAQNNETTCIKHPYLNGETAEINPTSDTVEQEITMSHTKEKLAIEDDKKFNLEEVQGTVKETKMQLQDTTTESVSKEEPIQPIARAGSVRTEAHDESSSEEIQPEANVTEKSNKEVLTSHVTEKEGIWDNGKCSQVEEAKTIEEPTKMQLQEEEVQTRSPTPASVEGDTNQIWQQEALYIDDSEVNDNAKQGYIPKIAQDIKLTIAQETEKPETMDNVRIVREKLDNKDVSDIRLQEGTDAKQLTDVEISKSETEGVSKDEAQQPITNRVLVGTEVVDEGSQEEKESEADVEVLSNKEEQRPEYVTGGTVEINTTSYTNENEEVPTSSVSAKEGIENDGKFSKEGESKGVEEKTKMQKQKSPTPAFVKGDTYQIPQQETLYIDSEVFDNAKQWCIPAIELDKKTTVVQETSNPETKDKVSVEAENLDHKDATEIKAEEGTYAQQLTDVEMLKSEREGVPEDEVMQPISNAVQVRIEAVEESKQESQPKADATDKSNREVLIKKFVTEETAEINTNNYTEEQDTVQTSHANEQEGTMDDEKLHEEEAKGIEEKTKTQFPEEEFQTTSPIPAFIQEDSGQTSQQETLNIDESEVLDNDKQSCIPERELDGKSTVVQETNNPETKDNVSTGADNLDNKDEIEVTAEQGTCVEQLTNVEIPKSETKGVPKDEPLQPIANIVLVRTEAVNEGSQQGIQTQADVTQKSNKDVKTPEYVTAETIEKNTTNYNKEQEKVPSTPAKDEGIKTKFNHKEEANGIEEAAKIQSLEEEVQTKSPTPILIQGDNNQVPYKETLAVDRSEVIDNAKQSCITEIELDGGNSIVVQETEKPETKNNVNIRTRNFEDKDASEIKAEEGSYDKQVTEVERSKSLTEDVPEYEDPTEIEITVVVGAETVNDSNQEQIELDDGTEKKSNKEEQTPKYAADDTAQINTNNYPDEHDKDQTSHAKIKEGIDEEILDQMTKAKATVQSSKMHLPQEEIQTTSLTPAVVQGNTKQISQHELLHVDESEETIDYVKQSCIPEIELERRSTIAQETEKPESNDSISKITEMSATNDATKIRAEEETDSKTLADLKMQNSEIEEDQVRQPIVIITERVDDTKEEQIQLDKDITEKKPNKEEQTKQCVDDDTAEINTTSYTDQHDKVQTSDAEVKQGIEDDENLGRLIEDQATAESSKMQLPREEVLTISLTPACVQIDTEKILQQELLHVDESEGIDYVKQSCKEEIELGRNTTFAQETEKPETKDNNSKVTENSATSDATKVKAVEETDSKSLVNFKTNKSEIEEDQVRQPKGNAVGIVTERVNDTKDEEIQLDEDITQKKPNEEKQTTQCVDEETAEINTTSYTDQHDKVQTSDTEVKQGIEDDENLGPQIEDQATAESSKMQLPKEEVLTLTPASVQMDTEKILQQELLHVDESETIDYVKQSCKEEIELGRNTTFAQETEKPETKDNNSKVTENSATSDATKIKAEEGTDSRTLADFKTDKSEIEVDQVRQPIEISIAILTERVDDTKGEQIQLDEDITEKKPNEEEQTTQCVDEDTAEINTTSYIDQHDKVQTSDTEVKQGIEDDENLGPQIEDQATAESSKMQLPKEEVLTLTPASVQMDTEKILQQELLHVDESEAIDYVKQSCIEEIELGRNTTFAQETEKPETKDNISKVIENSATSDATKIKAEEGTDSRTLADFKTDKSEIEEDQVWQPIGIALTIVTERVGDTKEEQIQLDEDITEKKPNEEEQTTQFVDEDTAEINTTSYISKVTENSATSDATKIKAEEETDSKTLADFKTDKSEIEENQIRQPIGISVAIVTERVDDTKEEQIQLDEDITEKKPNEEEQTKQYVDDDTAKVNTTSYTDQHDKVQTSDAEVKQGIEDDENLGPQIEDQATAESSKMQLPKEEVLTLTPASVQMDTEKILQQELLHVDESETIDYVKQSCIEEIELGRNTTFAQETEKSETKDNISKVTENSATSDATKIKAEEETDSKTFADLKTDNSEIEENQIRQPIGIAVAIVTERVDDTKEEQIQLDEDITEKKPNEEEQTKQCVDDDTAKINTTSYTDQHDKVQTCDAEVKQGIEDDENFGPQIEDQATAESSKMQLPREEVLTISLTPAFVQVDTEQISQQELLHVDESEVIDYVKQCCIHEIELERKSTIAQETQKPKTKDSISKVTENLGSINARKIRAEEETYSKTLADFKTRNSEIEEDQVRQPIVIVTERVDDTKEEQIQLDEDITEKKSNEEEQTTQYVAEDTAEIHTTSYIDQHDKVQTSDAEVKQEIENDENFGPQVEDQAIAESSKMKLPKEEVQTRSPSAGFVQHDTDKILQQELLELDQSEVIDYVMQSCIPEIEFDRKSIIAQETEKTETEDNISNVTENLGTNYESKVREEEETDVKKFVDLKMPKSEIAEINVPEDELLQTITIAVVVGTETVDDSNQEQMRLEEDITEKKSNREEQTPQYVAEDTAEINTNNYTNEHDKVQTSDAEVKERIEDDEKFGQQEETKGIEETRKIQLLEKEVQTRSPTTAFVQGNSDQILQQELLHVDESEVIDYMKQSSLPEIQLDRKSTVVQETEKLNTKDNVGIVTEKLGTTDARKIRAELADFKMPKSEIEEVPEDEVPQPIAVAVAIRTETIDDINKKQIQLKEDITDKKSNKEQSPQYVVEDTAEINTNSYTDGHDKVQTSHAEVNQGIEGFGQEEEASGLEERNKRQLPKEEVQITSPTPAFVQRDTAQISQQELLHIDESEVIDYVKQSCIQEIELDIKSTTFQETEKPEAKDNVGIVTENIGTNDASEIKEKEETDAENLADLKMAESEIEGVPKEESLKPIPDTVFVENKAVIASQEKRQPQQEFVKKFNKEVQKPQYFTEVSAKIETTNDTEEPEEVPPSQPPKEKSGIKDDGKLEEEQEEKGIEEATKTQLQDKDIRTTLPIHTLIQGHFDQILQQQTLHDDESKGIGNAKKSCTHEMELDRESIIVEEPETKDNVNIIKQEQANNQSEKSSIQRGITDNITAEGLVTLESNRKISDDVCTDEQKTVKSCSTENLDNKNASEIRVEKSSEAKPSTYVEIIESKTQGEPEDKALQTRLNSSSNGNEGLDESSPEDRQTEAEFTENFNKDVQTPQRDTKVTAETNTATYPDKQQEAPASDANEKLGIQDEGKFDQEEAEGIEESIEKLLPEEEIQYTLPTPTSVQGDIDKMSQQQTLHDNEIEAINNAKSCMTEFELDRKSIVVEEPKPETKANVDFVKEEQADHQSEESSVQSFITNYLIVERHMTSESNKESSDDVDLDGHKKEESHLVEFLQIKDASEIRAKGIHTNQLTDIEIQKSETEGVAEDKGMQTMSSTTSGKNYASNECCQEEIQPQEEYVETHIKEVKTPYYEFDMQKQIPEAFGIQEDACQIMAENEKKLKSQLAPPNKETTFIDNLYSDGEIAKTNPINDIEKVVNPKSRTMEKSVIHDDSKFNEEKAKGIEEMAKIKLLDTATDSPQKEVQPKLPAPATVQGDTDQILQHQTLPSDASGIIDNDMRCIPENKLDRMSTVIEEPEIKANINIVEEEQSDKQSQEPSMQSLITEYITEEGHLASESNSKLSYDMNAKTVNLQVVENLGIKYGSKMTVEEVTDARPPRGVEVEKTKNEGVLDFKAKTLTNAELAEHETLYETNQETQPEEEFSGTYSKGKQTPQSSMESVITKHINSEGKEITESSTNSSYDEEEQEQVINTYTIENSEIKDGRKIMLEEASDIKEATDEPVDRAISIISPMSFVRIGIVDESIQEQIQMEVQPAVINTEEDQKPENDFVRNTEILEEFDLKKVSGNTCVENEGKVKVQSEANNQKTIKKHPNLEELETAETSPSSDTKELGKQREVTKLGGVSESVSVDITEHTDMGKLETQETENAISGNTKEDKAGDEFEKISPSSSVDVISRDSQDTGTKVLHKKSNGILSGVGSKVKHSISKVKKVITGKSSRPKTPPSSK
ncbi:uncharacterized protein [Phaseolus vulgaris]|uniref:uncharacterized protein isoform X34 n=1 Tax=Phaseolus vulgaris TaxID=3885 RepID=UPI0035C9CA65